MLYGWAAGPRRGGARALGDRRRRLMDVIALHRAGFATAVAPLGTALTEAQIEELWRLAPEPVLCFDGDAAGLRAAGARARARAALAAARLAACASPPCRRARTPTR